MNQRISSYCRDDGRVELEGERDKESKIVIHNRYTLIYFYPFVRGVIDLVRVEVQRNDLQRDLLL